MFGKSVRRLSLLSRYATYSMLGRYSDVTKEYDSVAATYDEHYSLALALAMDEYMKTVKKDLSYLDLPDGKVIELAAGTGQATRKILQAGIIKDASSYYAVEPSTRMMELNARQFSHHDRKINYINKDAISYLRSLPNNSVSAVLCSWGICYINSRNLREELTRVTIPGAYVGFIENRSDSLAEVYDLFLSVLEQNPKILRSAAPISLPANSSDIITKYMPSNAIPISRKQGEFSVPAKNASFALKYLTESGVAAGFIDAIESEHREFALDALKKAIEQRSALPNFTHRYSIATARISEES